MLVSRSTREKIVECFLLFSICLPPFVTDIAKALLTDTKHLPINLPPAAGTSRCIFQVLIY